MPQAVSIHEPKNAGSASAAELLIALPGDADETTVSIPSNITAVVVQPAPEPAGLPRRGRQTDLLPWLFDEMETHGARAAMILSSGVLSSGNTAIDEIGVQNFALPVLDEEYDLALARYPASRFSGLINKAVIYPLTRALYGLRVHDPLAEDWAFSGRLAAALLPDASTRNAGVNVTTAAISCGFRVCEVNVGFARPAPLGDVDISSLLVEIVGPLFADMESNATLWQRARGSQPVTIFGEAVTLPDPAPRSEMDVSGMVDTFARGYRDLFDIWAQVLSPRTLLELKKLARQGVNDFRLPDEAWARLVYEFALGHRQRVMSRDHLLRSLTPLYLAWVASYANEVRAASAQEVEQRLERLCLTFEASKPYLVSRWRWPDRFNP